MKLLFISVMAFGLCGATTAVQSAEDKAFYLARCKEQVSQQFGAEADIKLISLRRAGAGMRVRVGVRLDPPVDGVEKVQFMTCLVSRATTAGSSSGAEAASPLPGATRGAAGKDL